MRKIGILVPLAILAATLPMVYSVVHAGTEQSHKALPRVVAVSPVNGTETTGPVTEVGVTFANDVIFENLQVESPDGSIQVLFEKGETPFIGRNFSFALRQYAETPGVYSVHYLAWSLDHKSSTAGVFTFTIAPPAPLSQTEENAILMESE